MYKPAHKRPNFGGRSLPTVAVATHVRNQTAIPASANAGAPSRQAYEVVDSPHDFTCRGKTSGVHTVILGSSCAEKDALVEQVMRGGGMPGIQTVVVTKDRVLWQKSYGFAVLERPGPVMPMQDDSIFTPAP